MTTAADLYALQELDLQIHAREVAITDAGARLGETEELALAREAESGARDRLHELQKRQHEAEFEVDEVRRKIEPLEKKLYGGSVGNPKELMGFQQDVDSLRSRQRALEDRVLDAMAAVEEAEQTLSQALASLKDVDAAWSADQERLRESQRAAEAELKGLRDRRSRQATLLDAGTLRTYEALRGSRGGRAVAKVERGTCQACRITLPMNVLQKARGGNSLVQCSSCERILYLT